MVELQLATFREIVEELSKRFKNVGVIVNNPIDEKDDLQRYLFTGDPNVLLGLTVSLQMAIHRSKEDDTEDTDDV